MWVIQSWFNYFLQASSDGNDVFPAGFFSYLPFLVRDAAYYLFDVLEDHSVLILVLVWSSVAFIIITKLYRWGF